MAPVEEHLLVSDVGGPHTGMAVFKHDGRGLFALRRHRTLRSANIRDYPRRLRDFLSREAKGLVPEVKKVCICFAGPVGPGRSEALLTNLGLGFSCRVPCLLKQPPMWIVHWLS